MKERKKPVYAPFNAADDEFLFCDSDTACVKEKEDISKMPLNELLVLRDELADAVADWEVIIDLQLGSGGGSSLSDDRRKLQRTKVELRAVKQRIREMGASVREETAAA